MHDFAKLRIINPSVKVRDAQNLTSRTVGLDSTLSEDTLAYQQRFNEIENLNNSITTNLNIEANEKLMNTYHLKWMTKGFDSFSAGEIAILENMASSCPFVNGNAVYKARTIYATINSTYDYNDWDICHNVGLYKNGWVDPFANIQIDANLLTKLELDPIKVYPNPATDQVTIAYHLKDDEEATFILSDMMGQNKITLTLTSSADHVSFDVINYVKGIYLYKFISSNKEVQSGKLIVE